MPGSKQRLIKISVLISALLLSSLYSLCSLFVVVVRKMPLTHASGFRAKLRRCSSLSASSLPKAVSRGRPKFTGLRA